MFLFSVIFVICFVCVCLFIYLFIYFLMFCSFIVDQYSFIFCIFYFYLLIFHVHFFIMYYVTRVVLQPVLKLRCLGMMAVQCPSFGVLVSGSLGVSTMIKSQEWQETNPGMMTWMD
jgi:hypothetical protein